MASAATIAAVEGRLGSTWNGLPVVGLNRSGDAPADGSPFILVQYPVSRTEQITTGSPGSNVVRESGAFWILINGAIGQGVAAVIDMADSLAGLFRGRIFDGVTCFGVDGPALDDRNDEGNFFRVSIAVEYQHDTLG